MNELEKYIPGKYYHEVKAIIEARKTNIPKLKSEGFSLFLCESLIAALVDPFSSFMLIPIVNSNSKIGFINNKCEIVITPCYESINGAFYEKNSIVAVCKDNLWNVIDSDGKELLDVWIKYKIVPSRDSRMITIDGKAIRNVDNDRVNHYYKDVKSIGGFRYGFARIHRKSGWGVINENGEEVIPAIYEELYSFYDYPEPTTIVKGYNSEEKKLIQLNDFKF